ncbi:MAG: EF-Tu/IF-2/RF-3 family GTPase, partial [Nitrososphaerota archaeon]
IVLINKMDDPTVNWSKERFEEVKQGVSDLLKRLGYDVSKIPFIPASGWTGDNLIERSSNMPWYDGPTLYEALDLFQEPPKPIDKPLRIPIQAVYSIRGVGTVPVGRVETGVLKVGDTVVIMPPGLKAEVKSIEMHHTPMPQAIPGDNIGFALKGVEKSQLKRGMVVSHPNSPCSVANEFIAQVIIIYHPTAIAAGYTPVMHIHTAQTAVKFAELIQKMDPRTGQVLEKNPQFLKTGDVALVRLKPLEPVALETYADFPELGRFAIRDMGMTIAAGVVKEITQKGP